MRDDPQVLTKRLAAFVSRVPAKELARRVGCSERTAENMRRGHWPIARHWIGLLATFGTDITEAVFHPDRAAARLEQELAHLERQVAEKQAALAMASREAQGLSADRSQGASRYQDRSSALTREDCR